MHLNSARFQTMDKEGLHTNLQELEMELSKQTWQLNFAKYFLEAYESSFAFILNFTF